MKIDTAMEVSISSSEQLKIYLEIYAEVSKFLSAIDTKIKEFCKVADIAELETENAFVRLNVSKAFYWPKDILDQIKKAGLPEPPMVVDKDYLKENEVYHRFAKITEKKTYQVKGK